MDPASALIASMVFAGGVKVAREGNSLKADWEALKKGQPLPSHQWRQALLEFQKDMANNGDLGSGKLTSAQYSRLLNSIGKQPGLGMLIGNQFRNVVAEADDKLNAYWDERKKRRDDPDYAAKVAQKKQEAKQRRQERISNLGAKVKNAGSSGKGAWDKFAGWLDEDSPDPVWRWQSTADKDNSNNKNQGSNKGGRSAPDPPKGGPTGPPKGDPPPNNENTDPPKGGSGPASPGGGGTNTGNQKKQGWWRWGRTSPTEGDTTNDEKPSYWATPVGDPPTHTPPPGGGDDPHDADWFEGAGELDQGKRALTAPSKPEGGVPPTPPPDSPAPPTSPTSTKGTITMAGKDLNPRNDTSGKPAPATNGGPAQRPTNGGGGAGKAPTQRTGGGQVQMSAEEKVRHIAMALDVYTQEMRQAADNFRRSLMVLSTQRAGENLTAPLVAAAETLDSLANNVEGVASYLHSADYAIGAAARQHPEAPKNLESYT